MKVKQRLRLEIKEITAEGSFEGMLSPYGNVDGQNDVVDRGAYAKTLDEHGNTVPMLWQHKTDTPIGELTLEDRPEGLWCKGQLLMADPVALRAYLYIKARIVKGLSIGFTAVKDTVENGIRHLKEIRLYEGSVVTFPANEQALIATVKGLEAKDDFNEELAEIQLQDGAYQMRCALMCALDSTIYSDLTRDEKISLSETIIQQFSDAYMAFLPLYLDMLTEMYGGMEMWAQKRFETKAGAMISAANKQKIQAALDAMMTAHELMSTLIADEAGAKATTSEAEAADGKPEPVPDHSAIARLEELKGIFTWKV
jgi:HK97 family phage prohead protease